MTSELERIRQTLEDALNSPSFKKTIWGHHKGLTGLTSYISKLNSDGIKEKIAVALAKNANSSPLTDGRMCQHKPSDFYKEAEIAIKIIRGTK